MDQTQLNYLRLFYVHKHSEEYTSLLDNVEFLKAQLEKEQAKNENLFKKFSNEIYKMKEQITSLQLQNNVLSISVSSLKKKEKNQLKKNKKKKILDETSTSKFNSSSSLSSSSSTSSSTSSSSHL